MYMYWLFLMLVCLFTQQYFQVTASFFQRPWNRSGWQRRTGRLPAKLLIKPFKSVCHIWLIGNKRGNYFLVARKCTIIGSWANAILIFLYSCLATLSQHAIQQWWHLQRCLTFCFPVLSSFSRLLFLYFCLSTTQEIHRFYPDIFIHLQNCPKEIRALIG